MEALFFAFCLTSSPSNVKMAGCTVMIHIPVPKSWLSMSQYSLSTPTVNRNRTWKSVATGLTRILRKQRNRTTANLFLATTMTGNASYWTDWTYRPQTVIPRRIFQTSLMQLLYRKSVFSIRSQYPQWIDQLTFQLGLLRIKYPKGKLGGSIWEPRLFRLYRQQICSENCLPSVWCTPCVLAHQGDVWR